MEQCIICYDGYDKEVLINCEKCNNKVCFECKFKLEGLCPLCDRDELNELHECERCNMYDKLMAMYVCDICNELYCRFCISIDCIPYICGNKKCIQKFWLDNKCTDKKCDKKDCIYKKKTLFLKSFGENYRKPLKIL